MISKYYSLKTEAEKISKLQEDEKTVLREEIKATEDVMPCLPQTTDLDEEKVRLSHSLSPFLDKLLNPCLNKHPSHRVSRLKSSIGLDIVYAVSRVGD